MIDYRQPFRGDYPITLDFHEKWLPTYDNVKTFHQGIDYGCPEGTQILASADGTVMTVGDAETGYGKFIVLCHYDGTGTVYAHLSKICVKQWALVHQGDLIGRSGNTGKSTGPHLHFEWRRKANDYTTAEDPVAHLRSVLDPDPISSTPVTEKPKFDTVQSGICIVVADVVNVRCHCDMSRVIGQRKKGDLISVGAEVTEYMGLPFRKYWDPVKECFLMIAEHDPDTQLIRNHEVDFSDLPF